MKMKTCSRCKESKAESDFHRHHGKRDGLQTYCKLCRAKYQIAIRDKRALMQPIYDSRRGPRQYKDDPDKKRARNLLNRAVRRGKLERPEHCERCGAECRPQGHHADYSQPLVVKWLCRPCHDREDHPLFSQLLEEYEKEKAS